MLLDFFVLFQADLFDNYVVLISTSFLSISKNGNSAMVCRIEEKFRLQTGNVPMGVPPPPT